jgi:hypothetical protein
MVMPARTLRRRTTLLGVALAAGASLALAGCGGDPDIGDVEDKLAEDVPSQAANALPGVEFDTDTVSCPEGQSVAEGETFECTMEATERGRDVVYTLTVTMTGENSFSWRPTGREVVGS